MKFLPNVYKVEIKLQKTGEKYSVEQLRTFMLSQVNRMEKNEFTLAWIKKIKEAKTCEEIIIGEA